MESNVDRYVMGQKIGKFSIISVHLWLEHLLALSLRTVLPNPEPVFRERGVSFSFLIALCEAHLVIDAPLAEVLRKINSLRNKCAHQLTFDPMEKDWVTIGNLIDRVIPANHADEEEPLKRLCDLVEQKAVSVGAVIHL